MRNLLLVALASLMASCAPISDVEWNEDIVDFGVRNWVDGPPTEPESANLVNESDQTITLQSITLQGGAEGVFEVEPARGSDPPYDFGPEVATELLITFVGTPEEGQEEFAGELSASIGPGGRSSRTDSSVQIPITLTMVCDGDGDGDDFTECGGGDCDDRDASRSSIQEELCNGEDDDCNGSVDMDPQGEVDADFDGFRTCEDCDDTNPLVNPAATEACNGEDDDCNGEADHPDGEGDADGDGVLACFDCDDNDPDVDEFGCR